jgi:predicted anti-sigma-YlaC factor YlaD
MTNCSQAKRLFGDYWDDEVTQAEREWLENHFSACRSCRREYDEMARTLELAGSLPRHEASPDLLERVLARTRRVAPAPDRVSAPAARWVPATAAAALLLVTAAVVSPWLGLAPVRMGTGSARLETPRQPELVGTQVNVTTAPTTGDADAPPSATLFTDDGAVADSLFDHRDDIEFILDPVTLNRGKARVTRAPAARPSQQAVITF